MARHKREEETPPMGVLTKEGQLRANNFILDLLRPKGNGPGYRKDAVTFILDSDGNIKEIGTGKTCEVQWLSKD